MLLGMAHRTPDGLETLGRVGDIGAQRGDDEGDGVARALVVGGSHRHRDARRQRRLGQGVALGQEAAQRAAADRQHHVVERAPGGGGQRAQALHGEVLGGEAPLLAHPPVEHRQRRIHERQHHAVAMVAHALEHLAKGGGQLRQRARLSAERRHRRLGRVGHGRRGGRLLAGSRSRRSATGPERRQVQTALSVGRHGALQQLHAADAVDQAVVHLDEHRKAVPLQPLDQGAFPGRTHQVQRGALQAPDQFAQLALAARPGQRGVAHVVFEVDVVVLDPDRRRVLVEGVLQPPVPGRRERAVVAELRHHLAHEVLRRVRRQPELQQAAHMVGRGARLGKDPRGVEGVQSDGVHGASLHGSGRPAFKRQIGSGQRLFHRSPWLARWCCQWSAPA